MNRPENRPRRAHGALLLLSLALAALPLTGCGSDDAPTSPEAHEEPAPPTVLVLADGQTEGHVTSTLTAAGYEVRDGGLFYEFTGEGLGDVDAVVLLTGYDYNNDMDDQGETALVEFVGAGGGLLHTEWMVYSIARSEFHQIIQAIIPVTYGGSYSSGSETYTVMVDHPVTENLPATFTTGDENEFSHLSRRPGAVQLIRGSESGPAVVTWTQGGRVISWNMAGEYGGEDVWSPEVDQLLVDAVGFISHRGASD